MVRIMGLKRKMLLGTLGLVAVISALSTSAVAGQGDLDPEEVTQGWPNGRFWARIPMPSKVMFLYGVESGIFLSAEVGGDAMPLHDLTVSGFRFSELADEVDLFYHERSNVKIPVSFAYVYVTKKMRGAPAATLDSLAAKLRRKWQ